MRDSAPGLIAPKWGNLLLWPMAQENESRFERDSTELESGTETGNIRDRVQRLREKASELAETLDGVEKNLQEAAGQSK
jgi:hypothetical protein